MLFSPMLFFFLHFYFSLSWKHTEQWPQGRTRNSIIIMFYPKMPIFPLDIWDCDLNKVVFPAFHFLMFKLKSCLWISEGFNEVKKTLVTCCCHFSLFETTLPRRPRVLNRSIWRRGWVDVDATRAAGAIQKKATPALFAQLPQKVAGLQTLQTALSLAASIQPLLRNVWQNQEPKCRKRRVDIGRRVVRWTHPAGLPPTVHGSW